MASERFDPHDAESLRKMQAFFSPQHVDQQIRQAIHLCWIMLPADRKSVDELETQLRRIFERALKDLRDDSDAFDLGKPKS